MMKRTVLFPLVCASLVLCSCGGQGAGSSFSEKSSAESATSQHSSPRSEDLSSLNSSVFSSATSEEQSSIDDGLPRANGAYSYVYSDGDTRTEIFGKLEKYLLDNHLGGLTIYGHGNYALFDQGVRKGSESYLTEYGFGILGEGEILADLEAETNPDWKRYYHTYMSDNPKTINSMNYKGVISDELQLVSAPYFSKRMNADKTGFEWFGDLSVTDRPIPVNEDEQGLSTTYRVEVEVGSKLRYSTRSDIAKYAAFHNREVTLEDYLTPYKIFYTKAYGMKRATENLTGNASLVGMQEYYNNSKEGFDEASWQSVGIKGIEEEGKSFLEFTFNNPLPRFYATYYLSENMFAPVPKEFIEALGDGDFVQGLSKWGKSSEGESFVDHWLCTGPYMLEKWDEGEQVVLMKNPNYEDKGRYKVAGVHVDVLPTAKTDEEAPLQEFLKGRLHSAVLPSTRLSEYWDDPRLTTISHSNPYRLNMNTCDQSRWESLFGEKGSIVQTDEDDYWDCEPAMSNDSFLSGLSYALDRVTIAKECGRTPDASILPDNLFSDYESGVAYNRTSAHQNAISSMLDGTDGFGYSLTLAKESFLSASREMIASGLYQEGDEIELEIACMSEDQAKREGALVADMLTLAFNTDSNPLRLKITQWVGKSWTSVFYDKMMKGRFDLGFGAISGSSLDMTHQFELFCSDNRTGFTLNWGVDTNGNEASLLIEHADTNFSYDALVSALYEGVYVENGSESPLFVFDEDINLTRNLDGSLTVEGKLREIDVPDAYGKLDSLCLYGASDKTYENYQEYFVEASSMEFTPLLGGFYNVAFKATFPASDVEAVENSAFVLGIDFYASTFLCGSLFEQRYQGSIELGPGGIPSK